MSDNQIPLHVVPVLHALARSHGETTFAALRESTGISHATLNRLLKTLCNFGYALRAGHGKYLAGPQLVDLGLEISRNQVTVRFKQALYSLMEETRLNAELYLIASGGAVFLSHYAAPREASVTFRFGHVILNRTHHPAALFYLARHQSKPVDGNRKNFIVDRGGQWPELFRAASMIPESPYCLAVSGMITSVPEDRHPEICTALHRVGHEAVLS